ncbi:MAG TPA: class I SAM-dependent methyltransferase, partial [Anaerolineales bacterium]|nr:class I SAM-dependent methyltransferase [Anaerolineales bacterium]
MELNQQFYQSFAGPFSESRRRLQPGVARLLKRIPPEGSVLDLGCGPGTLALELALSGYRGSYLGLDSSAGLLEVAREALRHLETPDSGAPHGTGASFIFRRIDLSEPAWVRALPSRPFDAILAFAVLHHIPGAGARLRLASQVRERLSPE